MSPLTVIPRDSFRATSDGPKNQNFTPVLVPSAKPREPTKMGFKRYRGVRARQAASSEIETPLEPRAAVTEWKNEKLTVWTGTQRPFGVQSELAEAFHIPEQNVRVIMPDTGSGYGGKHTGEAAIEAARLAKAAGKPVKLVWTREEEFTGPTSAQRE
jgi:CO/xanthine dehydrogenase Mo-binding subunit